MIIICLFETTKSVAADLQFKIPVAMLKVFRRNKFIRDIRQVQ